MVRSGTSLEEKRAVFVVDDDQAVLHALKFALELEGYSVSIFHNATEILAAPGLPERGCLVVDYRLPDRNGLEVLADLRARGIKTPAVLMTSEPNEGLAQRAAAADVAIIEKPLLTNTLNQAIDAVFERRHR